MTVDAETLLFRLEASQRKFERQLRGASRTADRRARQIEKRFDQMNKRLNRSFGNALRGAIPTLSTAALVSEFQRLADANTRIENALRVTGLEGEALQAVFDNLFQSAQRNFVPIEGLAQLYSRAALAQNELGVSTQELTQFTENVAIALRVSGRSAAESQGALLQLSQAISGSVVRAEEFNSILEGATPIAQAAARGLEEAGGSVARLRQLVIDGQVSSEAFFRAFEAGAPSLAQAVQNAEVTVSQSLTNLRNDLIRAAGRFDDTVGASERLVGAIDALSDQVTSAVDAAGPLIAAYDRVNDVFLTGKQRISDFVTELSRLTGTDRVGQALESATGGFIRSTRTVREQQRDIENYTAPLGSISDASGRPIPARGPDNFRGGAASAAQTSQTPPAPVIRPVSLSDFDPVTLPGASSGRRSSGRQNQSDFAREIAQIKERTAALRDETALLTSLNPLLGDHSEKIEFVRAKRELLNAAEQSGLEITPALSLQIEGLANAYVTASTEAEKLAESQDSVRETAEEFASFQKDLFKGFITDLQTAEGRVNALENALSKVADRLLDIALSRIFPSSGAGGLGLLGSLFGGFRAAGGPVAPGKAYVVGERGPELFQPSRAGHIVPNHQLTARAAAQPMTFNFSIDATGADPAGLARVTSEVANLRRELPAIVQSTQGQMNRRGTIVR
ncbi:MAG: tape measure protein [Pseudomonadota bacterium]